MTGRPVGIVAVAIAAGALGGGIGVVLVAHDEHPLRSLAARWQGARLEADGGGVRQRHANDCGPAALAHCLRRLGDPVPYPDPESTIRLGPAGCRFGALAEEAARHGRVGTVRRIEPAELAAVDPPAILWLRHRHFVVYEGRDGDGRFVVHDPALGRVSYPPEGLGRHWGGEILSFSTERGERAPGGEGPRRTGRPVGRIRPK